MNFNELSNVFPTMTVNSLPMWFKAELNAAVSYVLTEGFCEVCGYYLASACQCDMGMLEYRLDAYMERGQCGDCGKYVPHLDIEDRCPRCALNAAEDMGPEYDDVGIDYLYTSDELDELSGI